jgi:hypothetical protein
LKKSHLLVKRNRRTPVSPFGRVLIGVNVAHERLKPVFSFISGHSGKGRKLPVFARILPMKKGLWLGAESNRRHVDFQSTALPTELPSRDSADPVAPWGVHYAAM